jgi:preprotein translocase subunit SecG
MLLPVFAQAQDERAFDKTEWERVTKDIDYSSDTAKERKKKDEKKREQGGEAGGGGSSRFFEGGNASGIMKFIIIVLAVVVVALLLRSLLGLNKPKNKKIKKVQAIDLERIEENIHEANLDDFIRQALEQQNFALAIRLYYLAILKELSLKNTIHWKKDKTNKDYLREMRQSDLFGDFRELTAIFERVWYGESPIQAREFHQLEPRFRRMIQQINAIPTPAAP